MSPSAIASLIRASSWKPIFSTNLMLVMFALLTGTMILPTLQTLKG